MEILSVGSELFHTDEETQTDGRTHEANSRFSQLCEKSVTKFRNAELLPSSGELVTWLLLTPATGIIFLSRTEINQLHTNL